MRDLGLRGCLVGRLYELREVSVKRRGFLGMLAAIGLVKLPLPAELRGATYSEWEEAGRVYDVMRMREDPALFIETYHGSFRLSERVMRSPRHGKSLISARVEETVRDLGEYVDKVYTERECSRR